MFVRKEDVKCERVRGAGGGGALTVTETALASPPGLLSGRACAGLSACLSSPCLVFSLRPSACSLYTASCSGLTCFLYIDIFIATQTPRLPPPRPGLMNGRAVSLPMRYTLRWRNFIHPGRCREIIWTEKTNGRRVFLSLRQKRKKKKPDTVTALPATARPILLISQLLSHHQL